MGKKHKTFLRHKKQIKAARCHIHMLEDSAFKNVNFPETDL